MAPRPKHFPPDPGKFSRPWTDKARPLFGTRAIGGYGNRWFYVAAIPRAEACGIILKNHYSGRIVQNCYVHMGVFMNGDLEGVLQFGYAMNPAAMSKVVSGTTSTDYLELNRMWLSPRCPRNSESRAISYAIQYIKAAMPQVRWLQSFADERCGGLGVVYQAANFLYVGSHQTRFFELDGEFYHEMLLTAHRKGGNRGMTLRANITRAKAHSLRQFRYVFFVHKGARKHLRLKVHPYPKRIAAGQ